MKIVKNRTVHRLFSLFMMAALLLGLAVNTAQPAAAQPEGMPGVTRVVTTTADSGPGSLRQAVADSANTDRIVFNLPPSSMIHLTSGQIVINKSIEIIGPGAPSLAISGYMTTTVQKHDRVFYVSSGETVKITGVAIVNGYETNDFGGGIRNDGNLTLGGVALMYNMACSLGGAVYNSPTGNLTINKSFIALNMVPFDLENCYGVYGGSGGGIANEGWMSVNDTEISNNYAIVLGGGIYGHRFSTTKLLRANIHNNTVTGLFPEVVELWYWGKGAGFYNGGQATITSSTFMSNVINGVVGTGAAIANMQYGTMSISKSIIAYNELNGPGAGIYNEGCPDGSCNGILTMDHSSVYNNYSHNSEYPGDPADGAGSGLRNAGGTATISYSTFYNNTADDAGAAIKTGAGMLYVTNSTFSGNVSHGNGGAIHSTHYINLTNVTITGNTADNQGGGLYVRYGEDDYPRTIGVKNTLIGDNTAAASPDCFTSDMMSVESSGGNLIEDITGCTITGPATNDQYGVDPMLLGGLQDNGGPTLTQAIATGSPAVDTALEDGCPADDQRGAARPADGNLDTVPACDIGAFEGVPGGEAGNWAPFANPLYIETPMNTPVSFLLTGADPEGDLPLTFELVTEPAHGTLSGTLPNLTYTPDLGFGEEDSFYFKVTDTKGGFSTAKVTIWVIPVYGNLSLTKTEASDPALTGTTITYTLTATNHGPADAYGVFVQDILPEGLLFQSASAGCTYALGVVTCSTQVLYTGQSIVWQINALVTKLTPGTILNTAKVDSNWVVDKTPDDDVASASTTVVDEYCVYTNDFETGAGAEWNATTISSTPIGARKFLGQFSNQTVSLNLPNVIRHNTIKVSFDLFLIRSWDGNTIYNDDPNIGAPTTIVGPDSWKLAINGENILNTTFTNWDLYQYRQAFPYPTPASFPARFRAAENNTLGYSFKIVPVMDSVYHLNYHLINNSTSLKLDFAAAGLQELTDESWGLDNVKVCFTGDSSQLIRKVFMPIVDKP